MPKFIKLTSQNVVSFIATDTIQVLNKTEGTVRIYFKDKSEHVLSVDETSEQIMEMINDRPNR